ncbi:unnamed protein product [Caenorhabditis nigoni]
MEKAPEFLRNNDHYLKACILYEVALKKPIFDSYRNFCDAVGPDAMEYPDFEFWYHRFRCGELDFDYDRSTDPVPKDLMDMPVKLMQKITKELDPFERSSLRSTNSDIKEVTDSVPPFFEKIRITTSTDAIQWELNDKQFECRNNYGTSCSFSKPIKYKGSYIKKGLEYLTPVFELPNLEMNHLYLRQGTSEIDDLLIKARLHVRHASFTEFDSNKLVQLLSSMKPGHLETITVQFFPPKGIEYFERIFETEQFKQAKRMNILLNMGFHVEDLLNFSHLKRFDCNMSSDIEPAAILRIRDIVSTFEKFESCGMTFMHDKLGFPIEKFAEALGAEIPERPLKKFTHRYRIPESNEYLEFEIEDDYWQSIKIRKT